MIGPKDLDTVEAVVRILRKCRSILFITGAGISAESGIPTYRGIGGLYDVDTTEEGFAIEEVLSSAMLAENPALTWKYLLQIGRAVQGASHNRAHEVLAEIESTFPRVWTLTQNVDGFHKSAGSQNLIEAHGNMHSLSCTRCLFRYGIESFDASFDIPPQCPECGALVRPDVVLFGELIQGPCVERMQTELSKGFDFVVSIGTSSVFPYIQFPIEQAKATGIPTLEINPAETLITPLVDYRIASSATEALEAIWSRFRRLN